VGRILHVCTSDQFLHFLAAPLVAQAEAGLDVHLATRVGHRSRLLSEGGVVTVHDLPLCRRVAPAEDAIALYRTISLMRQLRPALVHAHNPKGGLIGMTAALAAKVPRRVYTVHGLPHVTAHGVRRALLLASERATCHLAQRVVPVSASVEAELERANAVRPMALRRIGRGSADGVDGSTFRPDGAAGSALRRRLGIADGAPVLLFVGRLHREKGIEDLLTALELIQAASADTHLLVVGERDPTDPARIEAFQKRARVHMLGEMEDPRPAYAAATLLVLPSYREGLPTVVLEAALMEVPAVCYDSVGTRDALLDERTGKLVPARDARALAAACLALFADAGRRAEMGKAARRFVLDEFDPARVRAGVLAVYAELGLRTGTGDAP